MEMVGYDATDKNTVLGHVSAIEPVPEPPTLTVLGLYALLLRRRRHLR